MSYNVLDIIKDEMLGQADHVDQQTYVNRVSICNRCEHLKFFVPLTGGNCGLCGCIVKAKAKYKQSECPDKPPRWISVSN